MMKHRLSLVASTAALSALAALTVLCQAGQAAPFLVVELKSGLKAETEAGQIRKVTVSPSAITVHGKDGRTSATPVSDIQKIYFTTAASTRDHFSSFAHPDLSPDGPGAAHLRLAQGALFETGLYDFAGNRVRDLGRLDLPAGEHRLTWSTGDLAPGLYLLRISAAGRAPSQLIIPWMP